MNRKVIYDQAMSVLADRKDQEQTWHALDNQYWGRDRDEEATHPWHGASNVRYLLARILIGNIKSFLFKLPISSETVALFRALDSALADFAGDAEHYYDHVIKNATNFCRQYLYYLHWLQHLGSCFIKTEWDARLQVPSWRFRKPLFIIAPGWYDKDVNNWPWWIDVVQMSKEAAFQRWKHVPGIKEFLGKVTTENALHDSTDQKEETYQRIGISRSNKKGRLVFWERHYLQDGDPDKKRILTVSPDDFNFDFQDDRAYPPGYNNEYMLDYGSLEMIEDQINSDVGVTELAQEPEFTITGAWRMDQNIAELFGKPTLYAEGGIPGQSQNIDWELGSMFPHKVGAVQFPTPPVSFKEQMQMAMAYAEKLVRSPSFIRENSQDGEQPTAAAVNREGFKEDASIDMSSFIVKDQLAGPLRKGWNLIVENKPASLLYYVGKKAKTLPTEALSSKYAVSIAGTPDMVNRGFMIQKAVRGFELVLKLPTATPKVVNAAWSKVVYAMFPGEGDDLIPDPESNAKDEERAASLDVFTILAGGDVEPGKVEDFYTRAEIAMKFLATADAMGLTLTPLQAQGLSQYIAQRRELLKKSNPQQYMMLTQQLNALDQHRFKKLVGGAAGGAPSPGVPSTPAPSRVPVPPSAAPPPPLEPAMA